MHHTSTQHWVTKITKAMHALPLQLGMRNRHEGWRDTHGDWRPGLGAQLKLTELPQSLGGSEEGRKEGSEKGVGLQYPRVSEGS